MGCSLRRRRADGQSAAWFTVEAPGEDDVEAALLTYKPSGQKDDYVIFASGGQSGQVLTIGVPSMRLLKVIGVFTPEEFVV